MAIELKPNVYLTLEEVKAHIGIKSTITEFDDRVTMLVNMACAKVESHIHAPVMVQEKIDIQDGTSANSLVPSFYPVRKIKEVRIDYNGTFLDPTLILDPKFYSVRGYYRDIKFGVAGSDIVIKNDGQTSVIGQIMFGSVVQSVKVVYEAGLAYEKSDVPDDLKYATLLLVEYFYILRENRELGVKSKSNMGGQTYSRDVGIPIEIVELLEPYIDHTFGNANRPQKNSFSV